MRIIFLIGIGGGMGSIARYLVQKWVEEVYLKSFPLATFLVNVIGCLLIGVIAGLAAKGNYFTPQLRLFLVTGVCGGFTTFSTFAFENAVLVKNGNYVLLGLYVAASVIAGIMAVFLGSMLIKY